MPRSTLVLGREWRQGEVRLLLGQSEEPSWTPGVRSEIIPGGSDRFCLGRVLLAEVADPGLNGRLAPQFRRARELVLEGAAVSMRGAAGEWRTLAGARAGSAGAEVDVTCPSTGRAMRRLVLRVDLTWNGVSLVTLAPGPLGEGAGNCLLPLPRSPVRA